MRPLVDGDAFRRLSAARDHARAHFAEPLRVEHLAKIAGMSRFHFVRTFHRSFGETPHAFLTGVRIRRAKELLARSGAHVTDVCFDVGFSSLGSFSALFARHVGRPPSAFQREMVALAQCPGGLARAFVPHCFASRFGALVVPAEGSRPLPRRA
ncbi:MAG TPA: AraC family transcriptional regulator [Minicystis sp.]|nr:AraC family transcriptional regulator [Minicystis sp.]